MSQYTLEILTTNYSGQTAVITYNPCSGGTINLGSQVLPYNYVSDYIYGDYDLFFPSYNTNCSLSVPCPSPTPTVTTTPTITPTSTETPTPTVTTTPTITPTASPVYGKPYTLRNSMSADGDLYWIGGSGTSTTDPNSIFSGGTNGTVAFTMVDNQATNQFSYFNPIIVNNWFRLTFTQGSEFASMTGTPFAMITQFVAPNLWYWGETAGLRPDQLNLEVPSTGNFILNQTVLVNAEEIVEPLVQLLVYSTNKNISDLNINGSTIPLTGGGSYPVQRLNAGYAWSHNAVGTGQLNVTIIGSGSMTLTIYKNGAIVDQLVNVTPVYPYTRNIFGQDWLATDEIKITLEG